LAVTSSVHKEGNRLVVFDLSTPDVELLSVDLPHGHGVVWDPDRQRLYALAHADIRIYSLGNWETDSPSLNLERIINLPEAGGHDLCPVEGASYLLTSTAHHCWLFCRDTESVVPHPDLPDTLSVKSLCLNPRTGQLVYQMRDPPNWWSERLRFLHPCGEYHVPGEHFYKARWNVPDGGS
jgi:hypothetical protein